MSYNAKKRNKRARAKEVTQAHKSGQKIGRTVKLHRKVQVYPKVKQGQKERV